MSALAEAIHAEGGWDLAAYAILGLPTTIAAIVAAWQAIRSARHAVRSERHNAEIRDQVSNDHKTNLRDDIDKLTAAVGRIGAEVREDRVMRRAADAEITARLVDTEVALHSAVQRAESVIRKNHPEDAS